jgi:carboxymethylenebutenolidase
MTPKLAVVGYNSARMEGIMRTYVGLLSVSLWILASCAGGSDYTDDMAREHADDAPISNEVSEGLPATPVVIETVTYATVDGQAVEGYLARLEGAEGPLPGIVVIHEWWGLNDNIRSMVDQLAGEGYQALAVDLYGGQVASDRDMASQLMSGSMEKSEALTENLKQAFAYLEGDGQKVGTIGWCFGGGWSLGIALALPEDVDATVIYYGRLVTEESELQRLQMPILGFFGAEDQGITLDSVRAFEAALEKLGKDASIHVYEGADHAFANPSGAAYQDEPAKDSWAKALAFFERHLKG